MNSGTFYKKPLERKDLPGLNYYRHSQTLNNNMSMYAFQNNSLPYQTIAFNVIPNTNNTNFDMFDDDLSNCSGGYSEGNFSVSDSEEDNAPELKRLGDDDFEKRISFWKQKQEKDLKTPLQSGLKKVESILSIMFSGLSIDQLKKIINNHFKMHEIDSSIIAKIIAKKLKKTELVDMAVTLVMSRLFKNCKHLATKYVQ